MLRGDAVLQGEHDQERPRQQLDGADEDPSRSGRQQRRPPGKPPAEPGFGWRGGEEAKVVRLRADLRREREEGGGGQAEQNEIESTGVLLRTDEACPIAQ